MSPFILYADSDNGPYPRVFALALAFSGFMFFVVERSGNGLQYSKFVSPSNRVLKLGGRIGFVILYLPSCIAALLFLAQKLGYLDLVLVLNRIGLQGWAHHELGEHTGLNLRLLAVTLALAIHFGKRVLEVIFLHRFSGKIDAGTCIFISLSYLVVTVHILYAQELCQSLDDPSTSLFWLGLALFLLGICGNFYHHYLLANLRKDGQNAYMIPHGGLFEQVACPHYLFEIIDFWGIALLGQTMIALSVAVFVSLYLTSRSLSTKEWYLKKMDGFPSERKALIPFLL
ncbi:hypothetical protein O6H91_18G002100 [Diphasiastrum complanatum]|uniref:Uncharacterized protein n=1 Tax=Diphasiastrum complanatum TaxID=34168 RepID=A0ACC2AXF1_DIPCM|nr:hypothetical protein O6H91_18G002100 [Diphasiastrum complanatum]